MVLKGQNLRIFINNRIVALALSCSVNLQNSFEDASTKDDDEEWVVQNLVSQNWNVQGECVVTAECDYGITLDELIDLIGQEVQINFAYADGEHNATMQDVLINGDAVISSVTINAQNRERGTANVSLTGTGKVVVPVLLADVNDVLLADADGVLLAAE